MECEICGKGTKKIFLTEIEGVVLRACEECSKGGEVLSTISENNKPSIERKISKISNYQEGEYELIEDYGKVIGEARKRIEISLEELAKMIGEKESLIRKIEREEIRPPDKIINKLEKFLKVKLKEKIDYKPKEKKKQLEEKLRIADVIKIKD
jgi:putative transcription factor